jgi:carotenoid cleavage dioxygenase-like enzyme
MSGSDRSSYAQGFHDLNSEVSVPSLPVHGKFPRWLSGALVRTGPAKFDLPRQTVNHWFDGLAMLHRFGFQDGRVAYRNRFLRSRTFRDSMDEGRLAQGGFATDPCRTLFQRVAAVFHPVYTDNANVAIDVFGGQPVALTETTLPVSFDPDTLATLGVRPYPPAVGGQISVAHAHHDAIRRCRFSYVVQFARKSRYRLISIPDDGAPDTVIAEMPVDRPAYMHSFAMTARYIVLTEFPLVVDPLRLLLASQPFIRNYRWQPDRGLRFHVFEKDGGAHVRSFETDPAFGFHHVNAFEGERKLVVDFVAYPDASIIDQLYLSPLRAGAPVDAVGRMTRCVLPLNTAGDVTAAVVGDQMIELPRVDYDLVAGRKYRYVWGVGQRTKGNFLDSIVKLDVTSGKSRTWWSEGCSPGEAVFVPSPGRAREGEGVLLSVVLDARAGTSFLLVLDAQTLAEIARAECPHRIPFGLHGCFMHPQRMPDA